MEIPVKAPEFCWRCVVQVWQGPCHVGLTARGQCASVPLKLVNCPTANSWPPIVKASLCFRVTLVQPGEGQWGEEKQKQQIISKQLAKIIRCENMWSMPALNDMEGVPQDQLPSSFWFHITLLFSESNVTAHQLWSWTLLMDSECKISQTFLWGWFGQEVIWRWPFSPWWQLSRQTPVSSYSMLLLLNAYILKAIFFVESTFEPIIDKKVHL